MTPGETRHADGVIARGLTVEASKLYKILNLRAMIAEIDARRTR